MNECRFDTQLGAYLDRELPADRAATVEAHLATCLACAEELASLRAFQDVEASLSAPQVSKEQWDTAWNAIAGRIAAQPRRARQRPWRWMAVAAAAAALLAVATGLWSLHPRRPAQIAAVPRNECIVDYVETAGGYSSMYTSSPDSDVTIITLVPPAPPEEAPDHESGKS